MNEFLQFLPDGKFACALIVFGIALAESFIGTTFLVPGTLATIGIGALVQTGKLPIWIVLFIWAGTFMGDLASFMLARYAGSWIRRWRKLAPIISRGEAAFARRPLFFLFASRCSPYLKSCPPTLAGLSRFPVAAFLLLDLAASALDASVFIGAGMIGAAAAVGVSATNRFANLAGLVVLVLVVLLLSRECLRCPKSCGHMRRSKKRGLLFIVRCLLLILPWNICGWIEDVLGYWNRRCIRENTLRCLAQAQVGDIILVARNYRAPWGIWTHSAIVTNPGGDGLVLHAYGRVVEESYRSLPRRARICLARVQAEPEVIERAIAEARRHLGKPFSLLARRRPNKNPSSFSCSLLVWHAFARAGCDLAPGISGFVTPQDLADSAQVKVVCDLRCPNDSHGADGGNPNGGVPVWPSHVADLAKRLLTVFRARGQGRVVAKVLLSLK